MPLCAFELSCFGLLVSYVLIMVDHSPWAVASRHSSELWTYWNIFILILNRMTWKMLIKGDSRRVCFLFLTNEMRRQQWKCNRSRVCLSPAACVPSTKTTHTSPPNFNSSKSWNDILSEPKIVGTRRHHTSHHSSTEWGESYTSIVLFQHQNIYIEIVACGLETESSQ
jgi:hypothetical protein